MGILNGDHDGMSALTRRLQVETQQGLDPLIAEFLVAVVHVERDESGNGLLIQQEPDGRRWVYAYSVPDWVPGTDVGQDVDYASVTGRHLHAMLPPNVGVRLDPGHRHAFEVVTAPAALPTPATNAPEVPQAIVPRSLVVPELVRDACAVHAGTGTREQLLGTFRRSHVYLGRLAAGVPVADLAERGNWVCVFSSLDLLAAQMGPVGRSVLLAGRDLLDVVLPSFMGRSGPVGAFLDLGADHQISLRANLVDPMPSDAGPALETPGGGRRWWRYGCADPAGRRDIP